jgi:hypothetical protein
LRADFKFPKRTTTHGIAKRLEEAPFLPRHRRTIPLINTPTQDFTVTGALVEPGMPAVNPALDQQKPFTARSCEENRRDVVLTNHLPPHKPKNFDDVFAEVDTLLTLFHEARLVVHVAISERARTCDGMVHWESRLDDAMLDSWLDGLPLSRVMFTH